MKRANSISRIRKGLQNHRTPAASADKGGLKLKDLRKSVRDPRKDRGGSRETVGIKGLFVKKERDGTSRLQAKRLDKEGAGPERRNPKRRGGE